MKDIFPFMKTKPVFFLLIFIIAFSLKGFTQGDSCNVTVSLLTVTPGEELYSTFGHSALRIQDNSNHTDVVYNYGTFNFDEPDFYIKFIRGKLTFYLSTDDYDSFRNDNYEDGRGTIEQVLNLSCAEKFNIVMLLKANMMGENRKYKYDFTFDNCTTRLRDLIKRSANEPVHFGNVLQTKKTFRDLIYEYLNKNDKQWSKLGIDILLGKPTDAVMQPEQEMFLPDYLSNALDRTTIGSTPIVSEKHELYNIAVVQPEVHFYTHPLFVFSCLFVLIVLLSFSKNNFIKRILIAFDGFMFFFTGLLGVLLLFMWFGTDHRMTKDNFNLLWAWPTNLIAAFYIHSLKRPGTKYFMIYIVFNLLLLACWFMLPQHLNPALMPIIAILIFRSILYVSKKKN